MRRMLLVLTAALVMAAMLAITASNAFAVSYCSVDTGTGEPTCYTDQLGTAPCPVPDEHAINALLRNIDNPNTAPCGGFLHPTP